MFAPANQTHFALSIEGLPDDFQVLSLRGKEAISQPFVFDVELVSEQASLDLETLLHKPAFLQLGADGSGVHGQLQRVARGDSGKRLTRYAVTLGPRLAHLGHRFNQRIFQNLSVPEIITRLLEEHGILANAYRFQLSAQYPQRPYCVQYDESDLQFIQRLCEEEGLHYHFQHSATAHQLVFGDDQTVFPKLTPLAYQQDSGMVADEPVVSAFGLRLATRPSRITRRDYDFEKPSLLLQGDDSSNALPDLEDYRYPGRFTQRERGAHLAKRALERQRSDYRLAGGRSDQPRLVSGHFLALSEHPHAPWNDLWLLTEIRHEGYQPQVLEESVPDSTADLRQGYHNEFQATPWDAIYRPPLQHPKPRLLGSQSAVVSGPPGEDIHCDEYGRVKVQFHWDRHGQGNDHSSCWLRTASAWAGTRYGGIAIPRVGMEVLVSFLEGDPDQPLISGCLYHKRNATPYELPAHKTRSTFKSLSSPGGEGYNELRIEDRAGAEQIFIHAQRDWDEQIERNQTRHVGHQRHDTVVGNSYSEFKAEEHHRVGADRKVHVRSDDHLSVGASQHIQIGTGQFIEVGQEIHLACGTKIVLEAGSTLSLKAGGSFMHIDASGIRLSGHLTQLNDSGSPGSGTGIALLLPTLPSPADTATAGQTLIPAQANAALPDTGSGQSGRIKWLTETWGDPEEGDDAKEIKA